MLKSPQTIRFFCNGSAVYVPVVCHALIFMSSLILKNKMRKHSDSFLLSLCCPLVKTQFWHLHLSELQFCTFVKLQSVPSFVWILNKQTSLKAVQCVSI